MKTRQVRRDEAESADGDDALARDPSLEPVIRLLVDAAPAAGIDLVPRWREILTEERRRRIAGVDSVRRRLRFTAFVRYAAVLAVGVGVGGAAAAFLGDRGERDSGGGRVVGTVEPPHYSPAQRNLMFAMIESTSPLGGDVLGRASRELGRCVACHDAGLRSKLERRGP